MRQASWKFVEKYYADDIKERDSAESRFYLSWLRDVKGGSVLCLGCGPNLYDDILRFGSVPELVVGIDINKNNIAFMRKSRHPELLRCKAYAKNRGIRTKLVVGNILKPKKEFAGRFDCVYAVGVIGMFKKSDLKVLLDNIHLYLKPKGVLVDVDWTDCQLPEEKYSERRSFNWYSRQGPGIREISRMMQNAGFKIVKHKVYNVPDKKEYLWGRIYGYAAGKS